MLVLNKYLRELGFNEDSFPFKKEINEETGEFDPRYLPDEDGFINAEFFSLDATLDMEIYSRLCYFRDNCLHGYPGFMEVRYPNDPDKAYEKWCEIIDVMIEGFKLSILSDEDDTWDKSKYPDERTRINLSKNRIKKIKRARRYFAKYGCYLWW